MHANPGGQARHPLPPPKVPAGHGVTVVDCVAALDGDMLAEALVDALTEALREPLVLQDDDALEEKVDDDVWE